MTKSATSFTRQSTVPRGMALDTFAIQRDKYVRKNVIDPMIGVGKKKAQKKDK